MWARQQPRVAHACKANSEFPLHGQHPPMMDETMDSNESHCPQLQTRVPRIEQHTSDRGLMTQRIPLSSVTLCSPINSRGWTTQRIPTSSAAHVCNTNSEFHGPLHAQQQPGLDDATDSIEFRDPVQAKQQPRLDDATDSNEFRGPCLQHKLRVPCPFAGPTLAGVGRRNGFQ